MNHGSARKHLGDRNVNTMQKWLSDAALPPTAGGDFSHKPPSHSMIPPARVPHPSTSKKGPATPRTPNFGSYGTGASHPSDIHPGAVRDAPPSFNHAGGQCARMRRTSTRSITRLCKLRMTCFSTGLVKECSKTFRK